jgi:SrtB family sortase
LKKFVQLLLVIVSGALVGVMIFSAYKLITDKLDHKEARVKDSGASSEYALKQSVSPTPRVYSPEAEEGIQLDDEVSPLNSMYDLDKFFSDYPDAVAWIYSPSTPIDYGVVEAEDNDFYLDHFLDGSRSLSGSLFVDCNCRRDFSSENTVIYGHHMQDGSKFASLVNYKNVNYYQEHPIMYLSTRDMNYRVEIFAAYLTDADSVTYTFTFDSVEEYEAYLRRMVSQSDFQANVQLSTSDRIITLSTCSYEFYDARYVVQGKLVPIH